MGKAPAPLNASRNTWWRRAAFSSRRSSRFAADSSTWPRKASVTCQASRLVQRRSWRPARSGPASASSSSSAAAGGAMATNSRISSPRPPWASGGLNRCAGTERARRAILSREPRYPCTHLDRVWPPFEAWPLYKLAPLSWHREPGAPLAAARRARAAGAGRGDRLDHPLAADALDHVVDAGGERLPRPRDRRPGTCRCAAGSGLASDRTPYRRFRSPAMLPLRRRRTVHRPGRWCRPPASGARVRRRTDPRRPPAPPTYTVWQPMRAVRAVVHSRPPSPSIHSTWFSQQEQGRHRGGVVGLVPDRVLQRHPQRQEVGDVPPAGGDLVQTRSAAAGDIRASHSPPSEPRPFCGAK